MNFSARIIQTPKTKIHKPSKKSNFASVVSVTYKQLLIFYPPIYLGTYQFLSIMGDRDSKFAVEDVENVPSEPSTEHSISSILRKEPKDSNNLNDSGNITETKGG